MRQKDEVDYSRLHLPGKWVGLVDRDGDPQQAHAVNLNLVTDVWCQLDKETGGWSVYVQVSNNKVRMGAYVSEDRAREAVEKMTTRPPPPDPIEPVDPDTVIDGLLTTRERLQGEHL